MPREKGQGLVHQARTKLSHRGLAESRDFFRTSEFFLHGKPTCTHRFVQLGGQSSNWRPKNSTTEGSYQKLIAWARCIHAQDCAIFYLGHRFRER
jgi:hypothetical protein